MTKKDYWDAPEAHTKLKMEIASKYFGAWASIMLRANKGKSLVYLDLFSGRGKFKNEELATPALILDEVHKNAPLQSVLQLHFYEKEKEDFEVLEEVILNHPVYRKLQFKPKLNNVEINEDLIGRLPLRHSTFCFVDPFGHRGVSLNLISTVTRQWGCDCLFYLSTYSIRRNLKKEIERTYITSLFGKDGLAHLVKQKERLTGAAFDREVIKCLRDKLSAINKYYFREFRIEFQGNQQSNYYLVFVTKHELGFQRMMSIMEKVSDKDAQEYPFYRFRNWRARETTSDLGISEIRDSIVARFRNEFIGLTITVEKLLAQCRVKGYAYSDKYLKSSLRYMESMGAISVDPSAEQRRVNTLADSCVVTFMGEVYGN